ncbi:MAG TPA: hypothetical protein VM925_11895 [Labilithrix sp.]|nr:hypothetical protein [Labilithrix sp.]
MKRLLVIGVVSAVALPGTTAWADPPVESISVNCPTTRSTTFGYTGSIVATINVPESTTDFGGTQGTPVTVYHGFNWRKPVTGIYHEVDHPGSDLKSPSHTVTLTVYLHDEFWKEVSGHASVWVKAPQFGLNNNSQFQANLKASCPAVFAGTLPEQKPKRIGQSTPQTPGELTPEQQDELDEEQGQDQQPGEP